jgi:hypothetical protein
MFQATSTQIEISHPCWQHIDQIYPEGKNLLALAIDTMEAIRVELASGKPIEAASLTRLCDHALIDIRAAEGHLGDAVMVMNGEPLTID